MSFCSGKKRYRGFDELRRKRDKIVWSRCEGFESNRDGMALDFLNGS